MEYLHMPFSRMTLSDFVKCSMTQSIEQVP